jgi:hypothetical protein
MLKLKEVKSPMLEVEMPDGQVRRYEPFAVIRAMSPALENKDLGYVELIETLRRVFDLPAEITDVQVLALVKALVALVEESANVKGLLPVPRN